MAPFKRWRIDLTGTWQPRERVRDVFESHRIVSQAEPNRLTPEHRMCSGSLSRPFLRRTPHLASSRLHVRIRHHYHGRSLSETRHGGKEGRVVVVRREEI